MGGGESISFWMTILGMVSCPRERMMKLAWKTADDGDFVRSTDSVSARAVASNGSDFSPVNSSLVSSVAGHSVRHLRRAIPGYSIVTEK